MYKMMLNDDEVSLSGVGRRGEEEEGLVIVWRVVALSLRRMSMHKQQNKHRPP